jgi:hypothetical protein
LGFAGAAALGGDAGLAAAAGFEAAGFAGGEAAFIAGEEGFPGDAGVWARTTEPANAVAASSRRNKAEVTTVG